LFLALGVVAAVLCFYQWTVTSNSPDSQPLLAGPQGDYYQLLTDSLLHGHLYLDVAPDPILLRARDPFDPRQRIGAVLPHDVSFHGGHFYIYYGVTPVLLLRLPWRVATGHDLPQNYSVLIFVAAGYLAAAGTWFALRRRYFPESGTLALLSGLAALGLASMTHAVLRRSSIWEEPIAAGYCCAMLMVLCLYRALHSSRRAAWLAAAGLCLGLAIGARPNYAVAAPVLLVPLFWDWRHGRRDRPGSRWPDGIWWGRAAALAGAFGAVGLGLAWYNYARFGSPLELGTSYMFTNPYGSAGRNLGLRFLGFNAYVYYLAPAQWSRYFPFAKMIHSPPLPSGYSGMEFVYGLLPNFPFIGLALLAPLAWWRRPGADGETLREFAVAVAALFLTVGGLLVFFLSATARYMVDFAPALMLLAGLGLLGVERAAPRNLRTPVRVLAAAAAAFSGFVGIMLNVELHDLLRQSNPAAYRRLAHAFDTPVAATERLAGTRHGPLELSLQFPRRAAGTIEPLVTTGWEYESDFLFVRYLEGDLLQLGFDHANQPVIWGPALEVARERSHQLEVQMGSLFPPVGSPFFDRMSRFAAAGFTRWLRVTLDGQPVFDRIQDCYDASPGCIYLGGSPLQPPDFGRRFSGRLVSAHLGPIAFAPPLRPGYGTYEMTLVLPENFPLALPLVTSGRTGRADILLVRQVGPGKVRFGYDHWGIGSWESGDVPMASGVRHILRVALPGLRSPDSAPEPGPNLRLDLDGRPVWARDVPFYPERPEAFSFGENHLGASTCDTDFTGVILEVRRL
jgi:hypothetical protein